VLSMPGTWEEICKTYMLDAAGAQGRGTSSLECVPDETCQNCDHPGCPGKRSCLFPCAACGKTGCLVTEDKHLANKCTCSPRPMHLRQDCVVPCRPCFQKGIFDVAAPTCERHCAPCGQRKGSSKHETSACDRGRCPLCPGVHFTQDCPLLVCRDWRHVNYARRDNDNCKCCRTCGHPDDLFGLAVDDHTCQWTTRWQSLTHNDQPTINITAPVLQCRADETHVLVPAHTLWPIRKAGYDRLAREMAEYAANNSLDKSGQQERPSDTRPVIECAQCFALRYEGGDYKSQTPGQLRPQH
jgi:hypothetical protein